MDISISNIIVKLENMQTMQSIQNMHVSKAFVRSEDRNISPWTSFMKPHYLCTGDISGGTVGEQFILDISPVIVVPRIESTYV